MSLRIMSKADAERMLMEYQEFSHPDYVEGEFWFRYEGFSEESNRYEYTVNHETEGIIGVSKEDAVCYIYRNRKRLNHADFSMVKATRRVEE